MVIGPEPPYADTSMRQLMLVFACTSLATMAPAQTGEFQRIHAAIVGAGPTFPAANAAAWLKTAPLLSPVSKYRFPGFLQPDGSLKVAFAGADNPDRDYTIPFLGRYMMPSPWTRIAFSPAGKIVYSGFDPSNGSSSAECSICFSQPGRADSAVGNAGYSFGHNRNFHVGTAFDLAAPSTDNRTIGYVPAARGADGFSSVSLEVGVRF